MKWFHKKSLIWRTTASLIWTTYFSDWRQAQCWAGKDHKGSEQVIYFHFHINLYNTPHHTHFHFHTHFHSATHRLKFAGSSTSVSGVSLAGLLPPTSHLVTYQVLIKIMTWVCVMLTNIDAREAWPNQGARKASHGFYQTGDISLLSQTSKQNGHKSLLSQTGDKSLSADRMHLQ